MQYDKSCKKIGTNWTISITVLAISSGMWSSEPQSIHRQFVLHELCCSLTVVSCHLLPTPTAVSTQSKGAHWCNSHFIHCTKIEVGDGVWGCTRAQHWASAVRGGSPSPVLHRVTSDHLTRSQCWSAPSDSDLACCIQCHHWQTSSSGVRYICMTVSRCDEFEMLYILLEYFIQYHHRHTTSNGCRYICWEHSEHIDMSLHEFVTLVLNIMLY